MIGCALNSFIHTKLRITKCTKIICEFSETNLYVAEFCLSNQPMVFISKSCNGLLITVFICSFSYVADEAQVKSGMKD